MSQNSGAHDETDACAGKGGNGNNGGKSPKWWLWSLIAVIFVTALVVGVNMAFTNQEDTASQAAPQTIAGSSVTFVTRDFAVL